MFCALLSFYGAQAQTYYTVDELPNPQVSSRTNVCNPDGLLSAAATDSLNHLAARMQQSTGVQLAIAIVSNFNKDQRNFDFATNLFRKWGVGGAHSNNGLLLFITVDRKQYRFITGYGLEGVLPDGMLAVVGRKFLVPAFRAGDYSTGTVSAISFIDSYLRQPDHRKEMMVLLAKDQEQIITPWYQSAGIMVLIILIYWLLSKHLKRTIPKLPPKAAKDATGYENRIAIIVLVIFLVCFISVFVLADTIGFSWIKSITWSDAVWILYVFLAVGFALRYLNALSIIRKSHKDDINYNNAAYQFQRSVWWYILFSPLILLLIISETLKRIKTRRRLAPQKDKDGNQLARIDRDENPSGTPYLTAGQKKEEQEGVYNYDIWVGATADSYKVIANEGRCFSKFEACPKCGFKTLAHPVVETVIKPTYTSKGQGKKVAHCSFCQYVEMIKLVTLPVRSKQSDSSTSSSSSGSGSDSSSSSSGSFGGGSTGGGGAGGNW